jgi:hypothetical protein
MVWLASREEKVAALKPVVRELAIPHQWTQTLLLLELTIHYFLLNYY